jgi:hypothetical protein
MAGWVDKISGQRSAPSDQRPVSHPCAIKRHEDGHPGSHLPPMLNLPPSDRCLDHRRTKSSTAKQLAHPETTNIHRFAITHEDWLISEGLK